MLFACLAIGAALALWLSAARASAAASATATQQVRVRVVAGLGWSTGERCERPTVAARCAHGSGRWLIAHSPATLTLNAAG
jgi:hypothetical protein